MELKRLVVVLLGLGLLIALLPALLSFSSRAEVFAQSPIPTDTYTPVPPTDTPTPIPPTPTDTPVPPTDTPVPPTDTPTPTPPPPQVGSINLLESVAQVDTDIDFSAFFTMPNIIHLYTASWDWGDGSSSDCTPDSVECSVSLSAGEALAAVTTSNAGDGDYDVGKVTGRHAYSEPGVYTVQVAVFDVFGQFDTSTFEFVTIYDPDGGFVTGGGWIDSPANAYQPDPTLTGKATFGFVSKYKKGADTPSGNTQFQFQVADLNFHSDTYDWLVVNHDATNAQFKGEGTINGAIAPNGDDYKFMLWARDGEPDTFRIKIWEEYESGVETVIYDNGFDQGIADGSIVIHAPKRGNQ
jgi:hypothetical protein